jgi:hypothetical protein
MEVTYSFAIILDYFCEVFLEKNPSSGIDFKN